MLKKLCKKCGTIIPYGQTYCDKCQMGRKQYKKENQRYYDTKRDNRLKGFYHSKEWDVTRLEVKSRDHGFCLVCKAKGILTYMDMVHHITELKASWDDRLNLLNLISLCDSCHKRVHRTYNKGKTEREEVQNLLFALIKKENINRTTLRSLL